MDCVNFFGTTVGRQDKTESLDSRDCVRALIHSLLVQKKGRSSRTHCDSLIARRIGRSIDPLMMYD